MLNSREAYFDNNNYIRDSDTRFLSNVFFINNPAALKSLPHKIPYSAEFQKVTPVNTLGRGSILGFSISNN
jgi:hypothetical protein